MLVYNKNHQVLSTKVITITVVITIVLTVVLYYLPIVTPFAIGALILWIFWEKGCTKENLEDLYYQTDEIKRLLYIAYSKNGWVIDGPVKDLAVEELTQEYEEQHERNEHALNKLKGKDLKKKIDIEKIHNINLFKNGLDLAERIYETMSEHGEDAIPEYKLEEGLKLAEKKLEEIKKQKNKKSYSIKDFVEIKDIFDSTLYFGERMILDSTRYKDMRNCSLNMLYNMSSNFSSNDGDEIGLSDSPIFHYFRTE